MTVYDCICFFTNWLVQLRLIGTLFRILFLRHQNHQRVERHLDQRTKGLDQGTRGLEDREIQIHYKYHNISEGSKHTSEGNIGIFMLNPVQLSKPVESASSKDFQSVLHQVCQAFREVGHMLGHCELGRANASTGPIGVWTLGNVIVRKNKKHHPSLLCKEFL